MSGLTLAEASRSGAFRLFAGGAATFNLVSSGLGLLNEAVLAEHGFDRRAFHFFLAGTTLLSLGGPFLCGRQRSAHPTAPGFTRRRTMACQDTRPTGPPPDDSSPD